MSTKNCNRCNKIKNIDNFKQRKNGIYMNNCVDCNVITSRNKLLNRKNKIEHANDTDKKQCTCCFKILELSNFISEFRDKINVQCNNCNEKKRNHVIKKKDIKDDTKKVCSRCLFTKNIDDFVKTKKGISKNCILCNDKYKIYQRFKKEDARKFIELEENTRKCNKCCKVKIIDDFNKTKSGKFRKQCIDCNSKMMIYLEQNRCIHGKINKYNCGICNIAGHLKHVVSDRVRSCLRSSKNKKSIEYLDCDIETFKKYIEVQFKKGMSWNNYGEIWHIDHIIPIAYKNPTFEEIIKRLHYKNTQPLFATENYKKGNRYIG